MVFNVGLWHAMNAIHNIYMTFKVRICIWYEIVHTWCVILCSFFDPVDREAQWDEHGLQKNFMTSLN